jgi:hypothetical protein
MPLVQGHFIERWMHDGVFPVDNPSVCQQSSNTKACTYDHSANGFLPDSRQLAAKDRLRGLISGSKKDVNDTFHVQTLSRTVPYK